MSNLSALKLYYINNITSNLATQLTLNELEDLATKLSIKVPNCETTVYKLTLAERIADGLISNKAIREIIENKYK